MLLKMWEKEDLNSFCNLSFKLSRWGADLTIQNFELNHVLPCLKLLFEIEFETIWS